VVAFYPSPAGATESELDLDAWGALSALNPVLDDLEPEAETLILDRIHKPPRAAITPTDEAYRLVGMIKATWEGISGGSAVEDSIQGFFEQLRERAR
jgi:hypothetical protein